MSGKPIRDLSNGIIKKFYKKLKGKVFIIGVGGVDSGQTAFDKIVSGANKDTNAIKLDDSQDNVYDPNKEGETRKVNSSTGYFGTKIS